MSKYLDNPPGFLTWFFGGEYSEMFHFWTGAGFFTLTIFSLILGIIMMGKVFVSMRYVGDIPSNEWAACETKNCVQKHLAWIIWSLLACWFLVFFTALYDIVVTTWIRLPHEAHLMHYLSCCIYLMLIRWGCRSNKHFKGMAKCNGNVTFHARNSITLNKAIKGLNGN
jgi:hypothetical protein